MRLVWCCGLIAAAGLSSGCGTTKWSDSPRTATEQLLVSDAVDRAISEIDFGALADRSVYLDTRFIVTTLDQNYVTSTLRQHMLASGCIIKDKPEDSEFVVEVRAGSLGTNRNDVLIGIPATNLPTVGLLPTGAAAIPEIALAKNTNQQAVCKLAVFAYDRETGRPVWQSGNRKIASHAKDSWLFGTGPFQRGTIYEGTAFAGEKLKTPFRRRRPPATNTASVGVEQHFEKKGENRLDDHGKVEQAGYNAEGASGNPPPTEDAAPPARELPKPDPKAGAAAPVPAASTTAAVAAAPAPTPPKAAYTPPPPPPAGPPPAGSGPQGNLTQQPLVPPSNPAVSTAGMLETYNLAKGLLDRE